MRNPTIALELRLLALKGEASSYFDAAMLDRFFGAVRQFSDSPETSFCQLAQHGDAVHLEVGLLSSGVLGDYTAQSKGFATICMPLRSIARVHLNESLTETQLTLTSGSGQGLVYVATADSSIEELIAFAGDIRDAMKRLK